MKPETKAPDNKPPVDTEMKTIQTTMKKNQKNQNTSHLYLLQTGTFSSEVIFINDPNYDHMDVYNSASYKTTTIYENTLQNKCKTSCIIS